MRLPLNAVASRIPQPEPTGWIFHVAHCGSTLLARALDQQSTNLVLREPLALRQLAFDKHAALLRLVAAMLSKRYQRDMPTIVKANVPVNFLLQDLADFDTNARVIFLYCGLRDYVRAILRSENHRQWLRRVTTQLAAYLGDLSQLTDAERTAALWLAQMRAFEAAIARLPNSRTLEAESFFSEPHHQLALAAAHLEVPMREADLDATVKGPLFSTYSKNPELPFDNDMRLDRLRELEESLAPEIAQAERWVEASTGASAVDAIAAAKLQH
jgi:hypothetical protein